ncbi:MAG: hypothetical protein ACOC3T_03160 [Bacteroidota bacterium]
METKMNKKKLYNVLAWLALGSILTFSVVEYIITGALSQKTLRISSSISGALGLGGFLYYLLRYLKEGIDFYDTKNQTKEDEIIISDKDKEEILQKLRNDLVNETTEGIIWSLYNEAEERLSEFTEVTVAGNLLNETRDRLKNEIQYLKIRSNINLFLGIVITVFGFSLLWYYLTGVKNITQDNFLIAFFPRFTLIVFIELFAYFFLRLYKESLNECVLLTLWHRQRETIYKQLPKVMTMFMKR